MSPRGDDFHAPACISPNLSKVETACSLESNKNGNKNVREMKNKEKKKKETKRKKEICKNLCVFIAVIAGLRARKGEGAT